MAARYTVLILRASDGEALDEVPANDLSFSGVMTGMGTCSFTVPSASPKASRALLAPQNGREVAVIRNDDTCVFNGPIVSTVRSLDPTVEVNAADPGWYLSRRVTEGPRNYGRPVLDAVRNLVDMAVGLPANATHKPSAGLYRYNVVGSGGPTKRWAIASTDRLPILEMIQDLADEDVAGFDYRWEYGYNRNGFVVTRNLVLKHPTLGVDRPDVIVEPPSLLAFSDTESIERAANRVHVLGAGTGTGKRRAVAHNGGSRTAGLPLIEVAIDRTNVANQQTLNGMANAYRRILNPPGRIITADIRFRGGLGESGIAYGAALLGDTVRVRLFIGPEQLDTKRRLVSETVTVSDDGEESAAWVFNDPADEVLG